MKTNLLILAALAGIAASAAVLLTFRFPVSAEFAAGYASVIALLGLGALEYRVTWKRLIGRS
jgi:hypothetical protein